VITVLLVLGTIGLYSFSTLTIKAYQMSAGQGHLSISFLNFIYAGSVFLSFIAAKGFQLHYTDITLMLAIVFGVGLIVYNSIKVKAASCGPMSILSMSYVIGGVTIPSLYGLIFLKEPIILHKILGILLIFLSFVPLLLKSRKQMVFKPKFLIFCFLLLVLNGTLMTMSKIAQLNSDSKYSMDYVTLYFFFAFLSAGFLLAKNLHLPDQQELQKTMTLRNFAYAIASGLLNGIGSVLNYMLSFRIPASVQFPLTQSSMLVVVTVMSLILYQEKPDKATVLSLLISIASIVLISI